MKSVNLLALLSILVASFPLHALPEKPNKPPIVKMNESKTINLNKADAATLTHSLKGIGAKRAEAIIQYRETHHGFKSIDELAKVKGFGARFVSKNLEKLKARFSL